MNCFQNWSWIGGCNKLGPYRVGEIVHWAPLLSARASYPLASSEVDGGSALNLGSYKWQATTCVISPEPAATRSARPGNDEALSPAPTVSVGRSVGRTVWHVSKARGQRG